ncbi:MAG: hypothetical protein NUV34_07290, partial [Sulfuricaulis sp.]|nr:hypothetical protein [Sulfuricaulis sp.]
QGELVEGEEENSRTDLTSVRADERPHMGEAENLQTSSGRLRRRTDAADFAAAGAVSGLGLNEAISVAPGMA